MCQGYKNAFDLVLRDKTESVKRRELRKHCQKNTGPAFAPRPVNRSSALAIIDTQRCVAAGVIPSAFRVDLEEAALSSWFNSFIILHRNSDTQRGYLECLVPLYTSAKHTSPVSLATSAVAMGIFARRLQHSHVLDLGRKLFGDALTLTRQALQDPIHSKEDGTLMAVLLLSMVEGFIAIADGRPPSDAHSRGALALVRHRGRDSFRTDISRKLFASVQTQTVSRAVKESTPPEMLLGSWEDVMEIMPRSAANRLTLVEGEVACLLSSARCLFDGDYPATDSQLVRLTCSATNVKKKLMDWVCNLSEEWIPKPARDRSPSTLSKFQAYGTRMDIYPDIWVVSIWNTYRVLHITVEMVLVTSCTTRKAMNRAPGGSIGHPEELPSIQQLVDDICASVPFCLGDRTEQEPVATIEYPCSEGSAVPRDHRIAAVNLSGWFLIGPIKACLTVGGLHEDQLRWIQSQMTRIAKFYGLVGLNEVDISPSRVPSFPHRFSTHASRGSL